MKIKDIILKSLKGFGWIKFLFDSKNVFLSLMIHLVIMFFTMLIIFSQLGLFACLGGFMLVYLGGAFVLMIQNLSKSNLEREKEESIIEEIISKD